MTVIMNRPLNGGTQTVHRFDNGYGASVVQGPYSYGGTEGLWEVAVLRFTSESDWSLTYDTPITDDVLGYLADDELAAALAEIEALPPVGGA